MSKWFRGWLNNRCGEGCCWNFLFQLPSLGCWSPNRRDILSSVEGHLQVLSEVGLRHCSETKIALCRSPPWVVSARVPASKSGHPRDSPVHFPVNHHSWRWLQTNAPHWFDGCCSRHHLASIGANACKSTKAQMHPGIYYICFVVNDFSRFL